jgi:pimeloyl-ACP methyl ester carboxylesterase
MNSRRDFTAQGSYTITVKAPGVIAFLDNDGVQLCVERRGSGSRHVLFLHGWISARRMWFEVAERLDPQHFTVHLLDFRGSGLSDRPASGHHVMGYAADALAALRAIDAPVTIVGHSMGGRVAQYVATQRPSQLQRLILVAPGAAGGPRVNKRRSTLALEAWGSRKRIEAFQRAAMRIDVTAGVMQRIVDDALVAQREVWFGDPDHHTTIDFSDKLGEIAVPTLCIAGEKDPLAPPARVRTDVVQRIPGALFVTFRNAGHNLPIETPGEIAGAITRFA